MKRNNEEQSRIEAPTPMSRVQGYIGNPQVFLTKDGECIVHKLPGNMRLQLHVNLYKSILGTEYQPKPRPAFDPNAPRPRVYGFIAQPQLYLSRDGQTLTHEILGMRVTKHVNFYKKMLGIEFTPVSANQEPRVA